MYTQALPKLVLLAAHFVVFFVVVHGGAGYDVPQHLATDAGE